MRVSVFIFVVMTASLAVARADTITIIDFETVPSGASGPMLFSSAGGMQTIAVPGVASITGGVVLGLAGSLSGNPYASAPNIYATASDNVVGVGGFSLPDSIVINIAAGTFATEATVPVINGMQQAENYIVTAFDNGSIVSQQTLTNVQAFGYAIANVTAPAITSIRISSADSSTWDFGTDTLTLVQSSGSSIITATPEPASVALAIAGLIVAGASRLLRKRNPESR